MASYMEMQFIHSLKKSLEERTSEDLDIIFSYLHGLEALSSMREPTLRCICKNVRYEFHAANELLFYRGALNTCWFILLTGSVFIDGSMYLPRSCFGKRQAGNARRLNECLILEPSEMIVIDYPEVQYMKTNRHNSHPQSVTHNVDRLLSVEAEDDKMGRTRYNSDSGSDYLPPELQSVQSVVQRSEQLLRNDLKRSSRHSDTSSAYSGSDVMQTSSIEDQDVDLSGLVESLVDSDDEDGYVVPSESLIVRDTVRECLEKDPAERTEDDIEVLLEFMQHLPAFANMTLATRRALCAVMVFAVVEKAGTVVMKDGEELDSWSVILNGSVEVEKPDATIEHFHMGDSFGITPTMEKLYHKGVMRTKVDDCQFVLITQSDYYRILHQGEENTKRYEESGKLVLVTEHRELDSGNRKGHIVIRGTPEKLMSHLIEEHSSVDPTYVEDFLLSYRTFLKSPMEVANKLTTWFNDPKIRDKVTRVVLLWVNNHFNDFETEPQMSDFLEKFENLLEHEKMSGQLRLLNIACATKAQPRTIVLTRATREDILPFSVLGGIERRCGIFISRVEKASKAYEAGLRRGDQIIEVNNHNFEHISHNRALEVLRGTTHLSITAKSNLLDFREMLLTPDSSPKHISKREQISILQADPRQRLSAPDLENSVLPVIKTSKERKDDKKERGFMSTGHRTKIRKALQKFNFLPRNVNSDPQLNHIDDNSICSRGGSRKGSSSSSHSSPIHTPHMSQSASNPDLTCIDQYEDRKTDYPEHVIKVYKADQTCKYFLIHKETSAREVVMLSLKEFGISDSSSNYSLCEVSMEQEGLVKQKRLPDQLSNLQNRISLTGRYYLKNNMSTDSLVPDELMGELVKDVAISFLQLNSAEVAAQLTLRDYQMFRDIKATEYIDDLFELDSKYGTPCLGFFSELVNREMFWVVTEVCAEQNLVKRMKILKQFIKIARHCKECKNFNSMFAVISGLGHGSVSRLRGTWDRLPSKYLKLFEDLQDLMDPSRNMSKYRNLVNSEHVQPPLIPFFPVVKKDLTFIHLGNDSKVDGLVNFEKLRMIAKEVRHTCNMASAQYDVGDIYYNYGTSQSIFSAFGGMNPSAVATLRRKRRHSTLPNPKKMYEEAQMVRRVRAYLQHLNPIEDEAKLNELSLQCERPPVTGGARKRDPSPNPANRSVYDEKRVQNLGPKFDGAASRKGKSDRRSDGSFMGAQSPEAVRKLMALTEKVKPHNPKQNPLPPQHMLMPRSPAINRRPPVSPRQVRLQPIAVNLSAESSSVVSGLKNSTTSGSVGSNDSNSPTNSVGSYQQQQYETDSGHNSLASSNFDSNSASSVGSSNNSPPSQKRSQSVPPYQPSPPPPQHPPVAIATSQQQQQQAPSVPAVPPPQYHHQPSQHRPPLPPYDVIVQNNPAYGNYIQQQYSGLRGRSRPPLPDYQAATARTRRKHLMNCGRSQSQDGLVSNYSPSDEDDGQDMTEDLDEEDDEQVSAV